jgi:excisionase family DNA binding protein
VAGSRLLSEFGRATTRTTGQKRHRGAEAPFVKWKRGMVRSLLLEQAAALLGVSRRTLYYRIRDGRLRTIRARCGSQRVLMESIEALLREEAARRNRSAGGAALERAGSGRVSVSAGEPRAAVTASRSVARSPNVCES